MILTVAAGTTAPEESVTVPTIVPKPWPYAVAAKLMKTIAEAKAFLRSSSERLNKILSFPSVALPERPDFVVCNVLTQRATVHRLSSASKGRTREALRHRSRVTTPHSMAGRRPQPTLIGPASTPQEGESIRRSSQGMHKVILLYTFDQRPL